MTRIGIYPGSFDPVTNGHEDIIRRSLHLVDRLIVAVAINPAKTSLLSVETRLDLLETVLETMCETLERGEKIKISGFGNFEVRDKAARKGRNPQTNEEIIISRRRVVVFKPSQLLRSALNQES